MSNFSKCNNKDVSKVVPAQAQPGRYNLGEQAPITCSPQLASSLPPCSIDTLHLSLWVDLSKSDILDKIKEARQMARDLEQDKIPFVYFSTDFNVHRSGRRHFTYHISTADTHIFFNTRDPEKGFPTCLIEIGSMSCWNPGAFSVFRNILSYFDFAKINVQKHNVSRVDLAADFVGEKFSDLNLINPEMWVSRAVKFASYYSGKTSTGISLGSGNLMLRVYDKTRELSDKKATAKQKFFEKIWCSKNKPVTRVEFQMRREFLNEFRFGPDSNIECHTIEELEAAQNALWSYCSGQWAKHCSALVDAKHNHQSRAEFSEFWKMVQSVQFNDDINKSYRKKRIKEYLNIKALVDQATGCILAAAASVMVDKHDISGAIQFAKDKISESLFVQYLDKTKEFAMKVETNMALNKLQFAE